MSLLAFQNQRWGINSVSSPPAVPVLTFNSATLISSSDDVVVAYPTGIASGDLIVVYAASDSVTGINNFLTPSGYTLHSSTGSDTTDSMINIFSKSADGTETGNLTVEALGTTNVDRAVYVMRLTDGTNGVSMGVVGTPAAYKSDSSVTIPSITTTEDNSLLLAMVSFDGSDATAWSYTNSYTEEGSASIGGAGGIGSSFASKPHATAGASGTTTASQTLADGIGGIQISVHSTP